MKKFRKVVILLGVWLSFCVSALASIPLSILFVFDRKYGENVLLSMDRVMAAILGWDGRKTVSAECGNSDCRFCRLICWVLNKVDKNHCSDAARNGL